jgi:hypothetical protein
MCFPVLAMRLRIRGMLQATLRKSPPAKKAREAERQEAHPSTGRVGPAGVAARRPVAAARVRRDALASRRSTAALARGLRPAGSTPGHASWDVDHAGVTRLRLSQSRDCTSRTGRSTGVNDARSRPGAARNAARRHRSRSAFESTLAKGPSVNEMDGDVINMATMSRAKSPIL